MKGALTWRRLSESARRPEEWAFLSIPTVSPIGCRHTVYTP